MPTTTFKNLESLKKERLMNALIEEFSQVPYSQASINRIIKQAGIPRGSFYQYFDNKEDAYRTLLSQIAQEKAALFQQVVIAKPEAGFYNELLGLLEQTIVWMKREPKYYRIGALMDLDDSDFIRSLNQANPGLTDYILSRIRHDQVAGRIRSDIDPPLLAEMVSALTRQLLTDLFYSQNFDGMMDKAKALFRMIDAGTRP
jgi:TetR/AcrR family transcriptional regulator